MRQYGASAAAATGLYTGCAVPRRRLLDAETTVRAAVERGAVPGAVLQIRTDGDVVYERAFGRANVERETPLETDDLFPVASLTKPVVATAVLQLREAGRLDLDDPIARYLPEFADAKVMVGAGVTRPARRPITVRHLLTHTSGLDGFTVAHALLRPLYERAEIVYEGPLPLREKLRRLGAMPLAHDPGEAWTYGLSSDVAGRLVEVVAGEDLDRYLARRIFEPLGMKRTYFFVPPEEQRRAVARHVRRERGLAVMSGTPAPDRVRDVSGGGGLYTTIGDYGRFVQALLDGGRPILDARSVTETTTNQIGRLAAAFRIRYGLSLGVATADAPGASPLPVGGFGWYGIYSTWFWASPAKRAALLLFCNVLEPGMNLGLVSDVARAAGL
jgi:CubicO group peptidase (beta-lactamase class C family)